MSQGSKPNYQKLVRLKRYKGYYINPASGKITYRRTRKGQTVTIRTGVVGKLNPKTGIVDGIKAAEEAVELELELIRTGKSKTTIGRKKKQKSIANPLVMSTWDDCVSERIGREKGTILTYRTSRKYAFEPFFMTKTLLDITEADKETGKRILSPSLLRDYQKWYLEKYPKRQFMTKHWVMWTNFLFRQGLISKKPDLGPIKEINPIIRKKNQVEAVGRVATEAEQAGLLKASDTMRENAMSRVYGRESLVVAIRTKLLILLGLRYGMRKMEAGKLRREKVDLEKGVMYVWSFKNHEWREIPLLPEVIDAFREQYQTADESEWVFPMPSDAGRNCSSQILDKGWVKAKKLAKIKGRLRFHDLRHTFATRTADENWPPILACEILDMTLDVYQNTYCKGSLAKKEQLLKATFAQSYGKGSR